MSSTEHPTPRFHQVTSLSVKGGGFLDGLELEFGPQLNCIIGGCGTGKTTTLEFLRFALEGPGSGRSKLIEENLKGGWIEVQVETKDKLRYKVTRRARGEPIVTDEQGNRVLEPLWQGDLFAVDVFSSQEIQEIAQDPARQRQILDRFRPVEIQEVQQQIARILEDLASNAREIERLKAAAARAEDGLAELPGTRTRLSGLPEIQGEHAVLIERVVKTRGLHLRRRSGLDQLGAALDEDRTRLVALSAGAALPGAGELRELTADGQGQPLERAHAAMRAFRAELERRTSELLALHEATAATILAAGAEHDRAEAEQERRYQSLLDRYQEEKGIADERVLLERKLVALEAQERELTGLERAIEGAREARRRLIQGLFEARERRTRVRMLVAEELTKELGPAIKVSIKPRADLADYRAFLALALEGANRPINRLVDAATKHEPRDLMQLVEGGSSAELASALGEKTSKELAGLLMRSLSRPELLYRLEVVDKEDRPEIVLLDRGVERPSEQLSAGQSSTAILPLLFLERERPLLIDEPERSLDNRYVYRAVVQDLRKLKPRRQIVLATHNANIAVNAGARVFVLDSDGKTARLVAKGDETTPLAEEILEGGTQAFEERANRYRDARSRG